MKSSPIFEGKKILNFHYANMSTNCFVRCVLYAGCTEPKMVNFDFNCIGGVVKSDNYDNGDVVSPLMCWAHQTTCKEAIGA